MTSNRTRVSKTFEGEVLYASRRRCCLCVFLEERDETRQGQIAHLNRNPTDSRPDNLVFLCLEHHDAYDNTTSQSKGYSETEVRKWRDDLYAMNAVKRFKHLPQAPTDPELEELPETTIYAKIREKFSEKLDYLSEPWRYPAWQEANHPDFFAFKARNRRDGVCLIERIDLPDGRIVVVCIQVPGNPGNSVTNNVETICHQVCERFDIPPPRLVWLEHYDNFGTDDWNLVTFEEMPPDVPFGKPTWTPMTPELWDSLLLRPKKVLRSSLGQLNSKVQKRFRWPPR